jgi:DNA-binding response OmpR family regulator
MKRQVLAPPRRLAGVHVLVVEDDAGIAGVLATALEYYGAWVTVASGHLTGLRLLSTMVPEVLVVATSPAAGDGVPLLRAVREFERVRGGRIATLALGADAGESGRDTALMAGFHDYLAKPVDAHAFCRMVARLAGSARLGSAPAGAPRTVPRPPEPG